MQARKWFHGMTTATLPVGNNKRSLCRECANVFSTTNNFDRHRVGAHGTEERRCVYPGFRGLTIKALTHGYTIWAEPHDGSIYARKENV